MPRLSVEQLDDRIVPSAPGGGGGGPPSTPDYSVFTWAWAASNPPVARQGDQSLDSWIVNGAPPTRFPGDTDTIVLPAGQESLLWTTAKTFNAVQTSGFNSKMRCDGALTIVGTGVASTWSSGTLEMHNNSALTVEGALTWSGGAFAGNGLTYFPMSTTNNSVVSVTGDVTSDAKITVHGTFNLGATILLSTGSAGFDIASGGVFTPTNDAALIGTVDLYGSYSGVFLNSAGTVNVVHDLSLSHTTCKNQNVMTVDGRTLAVYGKQFVNDGGTLTLEGGSTIKSAGGWVIGGSVSMPSEGVVTFTSGLSEAWTFSGTAITEAIGVYVDVTSTTGARPSVTFEAVGNTQTTLNTWVDFTTGYADAWRAGTFIVSNSTVIAIHGNGTPVNGDWTILDADSAITWSGGAVVVPPTGYGTHTSGVDWLLHNV